MNAINILAWTTTFLAFALMTYGIVQTFIEHRIIKKRMASREESPAIAGLRPDAATHPLKRRIMNWLTFSGRWGLKDGEQVMGTRTRLMHAGFRRANAPAIFYGLRVMVGLILPLPYLIFIITREKLAPGNVALAVIIGGMGFFLPEYILHKLVERRQNNIDRAIPDVIDLLIICMEAGLALQGAINRVAQEIKEIYPEIHGELLLAAGEMRTGISRDKALKNMARRTGVQSFQSLVNLLIQSETMGTTIGQALRVHAEYSRAQRALKAEELAAKMTVKMLMPLMFLILPSFFIVAAGPPLMKLFKNIFPLLRGRF
jgi:tight adherence protein C